MFRFKIAFGFLLFGAALLVETMFQVDASDYDECQYDGDCGGYDLCCKRDQYDYDKRCTSCRCYADTDCQNRRECCVNGICTTSNCIPENAYASWKITLIVIGVFLAIALPVASISYCRYQSQRSSVEMDRSVLVPTISNSNMVPLPNRVDQSGPSYWTQSGVGPAYIGQTANVCSDPKHI